MNRARPIADDLAQALTETGLILQLFQEWYGYRLNPQQREAVRARLSLNGLLVERLEKAKARRKKRAPQKRRPRIVSHPLVIA